MAAFFLHELDERMECTGFFYVRFMDDVLGKYRDKTFTFKAQK
jgi:hypothetical protein